MGYVHPSSQEVVSVQRYWQMYGIYSTILAVTAHGYLESVALGTPMLHCLSIVR